jgi:transcriptional regulator with XRE-family HTH domain
MAIPAHWEETGATAETRRQPRRKLLLEARGALPSGASAEILVHDISATGLLIESPMPLALDEPIDIELPQAGEMRARVVWESGKLFGCQFAEPISPAALSAAQLRSGVGQTVDIAPAAPTARDASFGARLQRLRKALGLSQTHIAAQMGVSKPTVWAWEHDKARPVGSRVQDLAGVLGTTPAELVAQPGAAGGEDVVARSRDDIAAAFGTQSDKVKIWVEL